MQYKDKVVWIAGASSGIGAELAKQFADLGAHLVITSRNESALHALTLQCTSKGVKCEVLAGDLSEEEKHVQLTNSAISVYGHIDLFIYCAGVSQRSLAIDTEMPVYRKLMEINYFAVVSIVKLLLPHFSSRGNGHIVVISSMAGLMGFPQRTGYAAAKHALKGHFETLQTENKIPGLNITIVYPGRINTPISLSALTGDGSAHNQMDEGQLNGIPVDKCVSKIIRAVSRKKRRVKIAREERILWWLWWFAPALYYRIASKAGNKT